MSLIMFLKYYYVLSRLNNPLPADNSQKTEQEVRNALGINYSDFKPDYSGCGEFPHVYDVFATENTTNSETNP